MLEKNPFDPNLKDIGDLAGRLEPEHKTAKHKAHVISMKAAEKFASD